MSHLVFVFGTLKEAQGPSVGVSHLVFAYLKPPEQFSPSSARLGPLAEYTLEHAALYRGRGRRCRQP